MTPELDLSGFADADLGALSRAYSKMMMYDETVVVRRFGH